MSRIKKGIRLALNDQKLTTAVGKSCSLSVSKREQVIGELEDFEALRDRVRAERETTLNESNYLLSQFRKNFTLAGGNVHDAVDAKEANAIILDLLKRSKATQGVKAKSMVSEEIGLGKALHRVGIDAVETDLGEFIVQLAGEPPSHITAPALHMSRERIGKLLSQALKFPYTDDPSKLTQAARAHLRARFLSAEFGISGANFIVAESGHLVIVENEGNGRMGFSVPPLFIAVTGIEKVVPTIASLGPILRVLARSATGQRFSSYTTFLKPTHTGEDGPREMHLVLLDNGRRKAMADEKLREMLLCIRCGACLNACPVYRSVGGHSYQSVYPGPMGAIWSNLIGKPGVEDAELPSLSTLCGKCLEVCPVKIDIPRMLLELRARAPKPVAESAVAKTWTWVSENESRFQRMGKVARWAGVLLPNGFAGGWLSNGQDAYRDHSSGAGDEEVEE